MMKANESRTKEEAIRYGIARYESRKIGEDTPTVLLRKDGEYEAATWAEYDYAKTCGWEYAGCIPEEARAMGLTWAN